jgi:hypothetical protein
MASGEAYLSSFPSNIRRDNAKLETKKGDFSLLRFTHNCVRIYKSHDELCPYLISRGFSGKLVVKSSPWLASYCRILEVGPLGQTHSIGLPSQKAHVFDFTHI